MAVWSVKMNEFLCLAVCLADGFGNLPQRAENSFIIAFNQWWNASLPHQFIIAEHPVLVIFDILCIRKASAWATRVKCFAVFESLVGTTSHEIIIRLGEYYSPGICRKLFVGYNESRLTVERLVDCCARTRDSKRQLAYIHQVPYWKTDVFVLWFLKLILRLSALSNARK